MKDTAVVIEALVKDACGVFDRHSTIHTPRPIGVGLAGGSNHREEVLAAFKGCPYFARNKVPIKCADSAPQREDGFYWINLDYFFR